MYSCGLCCIEWQASNPSECSVSQHVGLSFITQRKTISTLLVCKYSKVSVSTVCGALFTLLKNVTGNELRIESDALFSYSATVDSKIGCRSWYNTVILWPMNMPTNALQLPWIRHLKITFLNHILLVVYFHLIVCLWYFNLSLDLYRLVCTVIIDIEL